MALFLRVVRRGRWDRYPKVAWLPEDHLKIEVLIDLPIEAGKLSVFRVDDGEAKHRVAMALAANREYISVIDYITFDDTNLQTLGVTIDHSEGHTADDGVNDWHYDIGDISLQRLTQLAEIISRGQFHRVQDKQVKKGVEQAISKGILDEQRVRVRL